MYKIPKSIFMASEPSENSMRELREVKMANKVATKWRSYEMSGEKDSSFLSGLLL